MSLGSKPKKQGPTAEEKALAERAAREHNDYIARYAPREQQFRDLLTKNRTSKIARLEGQANAVAAKAGGEEAEAAAADAIARGDSPVMGLSKAMTTHASAGGVGGAGATHAVTEQERKGLTKFAASGRKVADQSNLGLKTAATNATELALAKLRAKQAVSDAKAGLAGTVVGATTAGIGLKKAF